MNAECVTENGTTDRSLQCNVATGKKKPRTLFGNAYEKTQCLAQTFFFALSL